MIESVLKIVANLVYTNLLTHNYKIELEIVKNVIIQLNLANANKLESNY